jgi:LPS-assembly protein
MNRSRYFQHLAMSVCVVASGVSSQIRAAEPSAADTDWVIDTSGAYLCEGYYSPPPLLINPEDETLNAEADTTDFDGEDRVILTGNAALNRGDFQMEANRISFLNSTGDGDAEGRILIRRPGSLLRGESASVNVRTNAFDLRNSSFVTPNNRLRGQSEYVVGVPNGDLRVVNGTMTFCAPGTNTWDLKAKQIFLNDSSGRGIANHVLVRVKEVPIFYTPILGFPLDDRRLTGFLFPSYSVGTTSGTEIVTPFYWNLSPTYDLLLQPRFMTARGTAMGIHGRYLFDDYSLLDIKTEQMPNDQITDTDRHISRLELSSDPSKAVIWNAAYEDASDVAYQKDLDNFAGVSDEHQLTSSVGASVRGNNWTASWIADRVDVIDPTVTGNAVKFSRQPSLTGSWAHYGELHNFSASGDITEFTRNTSGLAPDQPSEGRRFSSDLKAEHPYSAPYGTLTPAALGFARWSEATTSTGTQDNSYFVYGASLDGSLVFEKQGAKGSLHNLIPRAKLLVREPNTDPTLVKFDTPDSTDTETVGQIFLDNPISGGDFVGDTRELALSLTSRGINAEGVETYRITAGRTVFLADRDVTLSGTPETTEQGPLVIESSVQLGPNFAWNTQYRTVADGETMDTATTEFKYRTSDTNYITNRFVWNDEEATRADLYISQQFGMQWRALAGIQWEPNTEQRVNQVLGVEYESCCWRMALVHAYEREQAGETNSGNSVKLQLELKGLGALGRGTTNLLDRLLEDYEVSEARY